MFMMCSVFMIGSCSRSPPTHDVISISDTATAGAGAIFTWGKGEDGCLGHGEDLANQLLPKKIEAWALGQ